MANGVHTHLATNHSKDNPVWTNQRVAEEASFRALFGGNWMDRRHELQRIDRISEAMSHTPRVQRRSDCDVLRNRLKVFSGL